VYGGDADRLTLAGRHFLQSSHRIRCHGAQLGSLLVAAGWTGADADRSRDEWLMVSAPALRRASVFMEQLGRQLIRHAAEQRRASSAVGAPPVGADPSGAVGDRAEPVVDAPVDDVGDSLHDLLDDLFDDARDTLDDLRDDLLAPLFGGGGGGSDGIGGSGGVDGDGGGEDGVDGGTGLGGAGSLGPSRLRPAAFAAPPDGRGAVLAAMAGLAADDRIGRDEIEIRALDNGRYIVVLPGVADLSEGLDGFVDQVRDRGPLGAPGAGRDTIESWSDNDEPTVRKMRYAYEAALGDDTTVNEYSVATIGALEAAGVPSGAKVMLIGHSFGAYTAIDLAADPSFNSAYGEHPSGYHVEVTHAIAAGAETDWRFDELPEATGVLVVNNRLDGVYRAEDLLHGDGAARYPGHIEQNFWGGWRGYGHDERNYIEWLDDTGNRRIEAWLDDVGERYAVGGFRFSAQVLDPNR
jgi:hypothetical protein